MPLGFPKVPHPVSSSLITLSQHTQVARSSAPRRALRRQNYKRSHTHRPRAQRLTVMRCHQLLQLQLALRLYILAQSVTIQCVHGKTRVPVSSLHHSRQLTRHVEIPSCTSKASRGPHCIPQAKLHLHGTGSLRAPSPIPKAGRPAFSVDQPLSCMLADLVKCAPVPRKLPLSPRHQL